MQLSSTFIFWLLQILAVHHFNWVLSLNIVSNSHDATRRREKRWNSAMATLEKTAKERSRFDHRSNKARLIGIYVGDFEVNIMDDTTHDSDSPMFGEQEAKILVAIQPDQGGRKLIFLDAKNDGRSLGFIELETQSAISQHKILERPDSSKSVYDENESNKTSALRGMCVADDCRGKGYARLFLAIWLRLCSTGGVTPATTRINKPLLALTLVRLGFTPLRGQHLALISHENHLRGGIRTNANEHTSKNNGKPKKRKKLKEKQRPLAVEVSVGSEGRVQLYSPLSTERLRNGFSVQEVKSQRLVVATEPSVPRGRVAHLRVRYAPPRHMMHMNDDDIDFTVDSSSLSRMKDASHQMVHLPLSEGVAGSLRLSATQGPATVDGVPSKLERAEAMHQLIGWI